MSGALPPSTPANKRGNAVDSTIEFASIFDLDSAFDSTESPSSRSSTRRPIAHQMSLALNSNDKYEEEHATSRAILRQYARKIGRVPGFTEHLHLSSANGNFRTDLVMARQESIAGNPFYLRLCLEVYGVTDFYCSTTVPNLGPQLTPQHLGSPISPMTAVSPSPTSAFTPLCLNNSSLLPSFNSNRHSLLADEDMLAIMNARGTVILNTLFQHTPEQKQVVRLSQLALYYFVPYAYNYHAGDLTSVYTMRYRMIMPVIREDIQRLLLQVLDNLPDELQRANAFNIGILKERIDAWRYFQRDRMTSDAQDMMSLKLESEHFMRQIDVSFLDSMQKYDAHPMVHHRSYMMGAYSSVCDEILRDVPLNFTELTLQGNTWLLC